jgi:hypothetical protein
MNVAAAIRRAKSPHIKSYGIAAPGASALFLLGTSQGGKHGLDDTCFG